MSVEGRDAVLATKVRQVTGVEVARCYQCGKCTAGCPMAAFMDLTPNQVMRLVQLRDPAADDELLRSGAIWSCAGCLTCTQRCPRLLDPAAVMDVLREASVRQGKVSERHRRVLAFHQAFLATIERDGRMGEVGLVRRYKLATGDLFSDVGLAPRALARGKLPLRGHRIAGRDEVRRIFRATRERHRP
ncbi:MAG: 4Fe-4S dicluster domain-containing protein [Candidatus Latescibacterota bacterium]